MTDRVSVPRSDLEFMASFDCEHGIRGGTHCTHSEGRRVCNACWASFFAKQWLERTDAGEQYVQRKLRCPRCMGDGKHYNELVLGSLHLVDADPCPDCKGDGEANVDEALTLYMQRATAWKMRADNAEAILKRVHRAKGSEGGLPGLLAGAEDQRAQRIEKAARELVRDLRQLDEPVGRLVALEWALMGGDPDCAEVD